jgi:hypothetical protein
VTIDTTVGDYPSTSSAQLLEGDTVSIGSGASLNDYTVASVSSDAVFTTTAGLASGDTEAGDDVISTQSATTTTVRFTTANAIANGRFRILVPALDDDTSSADGLPDSGYFDFTSSGATVTCPSDVGSTYDFVSGTATASAITINGADYHAFECAYSGAGGVGTDFDGSPNGTFVVNNLINPAPKATHTAGTADTYSVIVQHIDSSFNVIDATTANIGVIEAVRVTASVAPQISFRIIGVASGTSVCGITTDAPTTATSVPFGELSISAFTEAAQALAVSTNAANGFSVTAIENDQLGRNGGACSGEPTITGNTDCIADAGEGTFSESGSGTDWTATSVKGFGYSLHDTNTSTTEAFNYSTGGTFMARQFPATADSESAAQIFSSTGPADDQNLHVCYRIIPGTTTAAGEYQNALTYTATATF